MATKFGRIQHSEQSFEEQTFHKNQTVTSESLGIHHHFGLQDDKTDKSDNLIGLLSESGSHWAFVHTMFYMSGSKKVSSSMPGDIDKFNNIYHNFNQHNDLTPHHNNKFHSTASVFYIPQQYFGERIKPGTFQLTARTGSQTNTTKEIIIKDDKYGNLYSSNAHASRSVNSLGITGSASSSVNYVGNLFYDLGIAVLTETGSWSGSAASHTDGIRYTDINYHHIHNGSHSERDYRFWNMKFNSTTPIFTSQFSIKIPAGDFNRTMNQSVRIPVSGSIPSGSNVQDYANMHAYLTGSDWKPYFTQIQLYRSVHEEPVLIANLPRAVQKRSDCDIIVTFRVDH